MMRVAAVLLGLLSLAATFGVGPETFRATYELSQSGDELQLGAGSYGELAIGRPGVILKGPLLGEAVFTRIVLLPGAAGAVLDHLTITGQGIVIVGADRVTLRRLKIVDNDWHGLALWCDPHAESCADPPDDVVIEDCRIERNALDAVRVEGGNRLVFRRNKVRYNLLHGWFDKQENRHAVIEYNEFAHNGQAGVLFKGNGMYSKGVSHRVYHNRFHHNKDYGFTCWSACRGAPGDPYDVRFNLARSNGSGGFVLGGNPSEASPGDDGEPKYVTFWHNEETDNGDAGMIP